METHSSIWGYTGPAHDEGLHTHGSQDLDMGQHKIINLGEPRKRDQAATAGYVANFASHLNLHKVEKSGDTMAGNLDMGNNKITSVGTPTDETDGVNKQYVNSLVQHEHDTRPYDLGRYIVFPHDDGTKIYFSVRARKKINLVNELQVEIKHNIADSKENEFNNRPLDITITKNVMLIPNPDKNLGIMELNAPLLIDFRPLRYLPAPWTLLFSARPGATPPRDDNNSILTFYNSTNQTIKYLTTMWEPGSFKHAITDSVMTNENAVVHSLDTAQLNHIALEYTGTNLYVWINGKQEEVHNETLGDLSVINMGVKELGVLSLYSRNLDKQEIIQHFIDRHVENFTDDEVLI